MKKHLLKSLLALALVLITGNAWGETEYTKVSQLDLTTKTAGCAAYNTSTDYGDWTIVNGANNNKSWAYFKMGGKNTTINSYNPCYIYSTKATTDQVDKITVSIAAGSLSKTGMSVNSWGVYVYSDKDMTNQIDYVAGGTITNSAATFDFSPSTGKTWAAGYYYKVSWNLANTSGTNGIVCVDKITLYYKAQAATEPCTVTFDAGTNGSCSTPSLTESSAAAGVTLPECTPNNGYVFKGWATTATSTTANAGEAGASYKPTSDCTLYAVYSKLYSITIITPENGTLIVMNGETPVASGTSVEEGTTLTIEATPSTGYKFQNWQYKKDSDGSRWVSNSKKFTYTIGSENVSFTANFEALQTFTINYMVNGVNTGAQENVFEDTALEFPIVNDFGGKVFVGWSEDEVAETDVKPALIETNGLTVVANKTYYAVFATLTKGNVVTKTDELDRSLTGVDSGSTSYATWSMSAPTSEAEYAGNSAGDNNSIQIRSKNNESGIVSTTSGGSAKKVSVVWENHTLEGRTLNVYGSNSAYADASSLYKQETYGTLIGTIVCGRSTELSISGEYAYIGIRSDDGAIYLTSISIDWVQGTPDSYSAYCTTVAPRTKDVEITSAGCATACVPFNATVSGAKAYYVTVESEVAKLHEFEGAIPANMGVLLKTEDDAAGTAVFTESTATTDPAEGNLMKGSVEGETFSTTGFTYYVLSDGSNGVGFYWDLNTNDEGASAICPAGKAILAVPGSSSSTVIRFGDATQIENVNAVEAGKYFDLMGREVLNPAGGIYILNGKKVLVK